MLAPCLTEHGLRGAHALGFSPRAYEGLTFGSSLGTVLEFLLFDDTTIFSSGFSSSLPFRDTSSTAQKKMDNFQWSTPLEL